jgi:hypothetical protein
MWMSRSRRNLFAISTSRSIATYVVGHERSRMPKTLLSRSSLTPRQRWSLGRLSHVCLGGCTGLRNVALPTRRDEAYAARELKGKVLDVAPTPASAYGRAVARAIGGAIANLPQSQRQVVVMRLLEGRSFGAIAGRLGVTEAAAKMRFVRGLEALRESLRREGIEP